jgi:hypothetical protein
MDTQKQVIVFMDGNAPQRVAGSARSAPARLFAV